MDTVEVYITAGDLEMVRRSLSRRHECNGSGWLEPPGSNPLLYIHAYAWAEWAAAEAWRVAQVRDSLGFEPRVIVAADVSGRCPGPGPVRAFVEGVLSEFQGVSCDGFDDYLWTLDDIRAGKRVGGFGFFDKWERAKKG